MSDFRIAIPARLDSTRLPRKPMIEIEGIPMIVRTAFNAFEVVNTDLVTVVTPDIELIKVCEKYKDKRATDRGALRYGF